MISEISSSNPLLFTLFWQSSLFVTAGLIVSFLLKRHPARAHQVLLLSMIAAVTVPLLSTFIKYMELGIFVEEPVVATSPADDFIPLSNTPLLAINPLSFYESVQVPEVLPPVEAEFENFSLPLKKILLFGWIAASVILLARLLLTFILGMRLVKKAQPFEYPKVTESIKAAASKLGIKENMAVYSSKSVASPVIWCWNRRPLLLLPSDQKLSNGKIDWAGILCHELAHLKRRDHIAGLFSEIIVGVLPWHPLLWLAKSRLVNLSEQACDDWVIADGGSGPDYAESLLDLIPVKQMAFVPAVVRSKNALSGRIIRILKNSCSNPRLGVKWILSAVIITTCIALTVAFAQTRPARTRTEEVSEKLEKIKSSFNNQLAMFRNMRFNAVRTQPYTEVDSDRDSSPQIIEIPMPGKQKITEQSYLLDNSGRFVFGQETFILDSETGEKIYDQSPEQMSFDGEIYQLQQGDSNRVRLLTSEHPYSNIFGHIIKPTFYMDHLFNVKISDILKKPEDITITEINDGLWLLKYQDPNSDEFYNLEMDPNRDFIITKMTGFWNVDRIFEKNIEYDSTEEDFYYVKKGTFSLNGEEPSIMEIQEFVLNEPEADYTLNIPEGTEVTDYTINPDNAVKYIYGKQEQSYEQIIDSGGKFISGVVVNENGSPVPDIYVETRTLKTVSESGQVILSGGMYSAFNATTDIQGRFAIEYKEEGTYFLWFNSLNYADTIVYDVQTGTDDVKVTLDEGGSISGRIVRMENGRKIPIQNAKIKIKDFGDIFNCVNPKETVTDEQGRFRFEHLQTQIRPSQKERAYVPRAWQISYEDTSKSVTFSDDLTIDDFELVVYPAESQLLTGKSLPDFDGIKIDINENQIRNKNMLVCFWDYQQRPSRNCVLELAKQAEDLKLKDIVVLLVQASQINEDTFIEWLKENDISFPAGMIEADAQQIRSTWGITSLPWLILTDTEHTVTAEGFTIADLDQITEQVSRIEVSPAPESSPQIFNISNRNSAEIPEIIQQILNEKNQPKDQIQTGTSNSAETVNQIDELITTLDREGSYMPETWSLYYDDGIRQLDGRSFWPVNMANNLLSLEALPRPTDITDDSWKNERFEFNITSLEGESIGTLMVRPEPELSDLSRKIFQPGKYLLSYERNYNEPGKTYRINSGTFLLDMNQPGMYELFFAPKLGDVEISGSAGGCYAVNFERTGPGIPIRGLAYINREKEYRLDGLPIGTYRISAVTQRNSDNVFVSQTQITIENETKVTLDIAPPARGDCSLTGSILGRQNTYILDSRTDSTPRQGEWFIIIRNPGSGKIKTTDVYEAKTMDSLYVVRGRNIVQETEDRASYKIEGIVPGEYTVTAIEHPVYTGSEVVRQQSKPLTIRAGQEATLDFDLTDKTE